MSPLCNEDADIANVLFSPVIIKRMEKNPDTHVTNPVITSTFPQSLGTSLYRGSTVRENPFIKTDSVFSSISASALTGFHCITAPYWVEFKSTCRLKYNVSLLSKETMPSYRRDQVQSVR